MFEPAAEDDVSDPVVFADEAVGDAEFDLETSNEGIAC